MTFHLTIGALYYASLGFTSGFFINSFSWTFLIFVCLESFIAAPLGAVTLTSLFAMPVIFALFSASGYILNHHALLGATLMCEESTSEHVASIVSGAVVMLIGLSTSIFFGERYEPIIMALTFMVASIVLYLGTKKEASSRVRVRPAHRLLLFFMFGAVISFVNYANLIQNGTAREILDIYIYLGTGGCLLIVTLVTWYSYAHRYGSETHSE